MLAAASLSAALGCADVRATPDDPSGRASSPSDSDGQGADEPGRSRSSADALLRGSRPGPLGYAARGAIVMARHDGRRRFVVALPSSATTVAPGVWPLGYAFSDDGTNWLHASVPASEESSPDGRGEQPALAVAPPGPDGLPSTADVFYAAVVTAGGDRASPPRVVLARSTDGGETFLPPSVATGSTIAAPFATVDAPSLVVDPAGRVHLFAVTDRGTPRAVIRHRIGRPGPPSCNYSCIEWVTGPSVVAPMLSASAASIRRVAARAYRHLLYVMVELRRPVADARTPTQEVANLALLRLDPVTSVFAYADVQPAGGRALIVDAPAGQNAASADFALDPLTGAGVLVWAGRDPSRPDATHDALTVQRFRVRHALLEDWEAPTELTRDPGDHRLAVPSVSQTGGALAVSWFAREIDTGRARLMGARLEAGDPRWSIPRDVLNASPEAAPAFETCDAHGPTGQAWAAAVTYVPADASAARTLTVHPTGCPTRLPGGAWRAPATVVTSWGAARLDATPSVADRAWP